MLRLHDRCTQVEPSTAPTSNDGGRRPSTSGGRESHESGGRANERHPRDTTTRGHGNPRQHPPHTPSYVDVTTTSQPQDPVAPNRPSAVRPARSIAPSSTVLGGTGSGRRVAPSVDEPAYLHTEDYPFSADQIDSRKEAELVRNTPHLASCAAFSPFSFLFLVEGRGVLLLTYLPACTAVLHRAAAINRVRRGVIMAPRVFDVCLRCLSRVVIGEIGIA